MVGTRRRAAGAAREAEPATAADGPGEKGATPRRPGLARWLGETNDVTGRFLALGADPTIVNLAGGLPDPALFPADEIAAAAARVLSTRPETALAYGPVAGLADLREAIVRRMRAAGSAVAVENVLLTAGSAQALDLLGKVLVDPGEEIATQAPTYLGALDAWRPRAPRYRALDVAVGEAAEPGRLAGAKFVYTCPNFSNPTGALVDAQMRGRILAAAEAAGTWLVEDDPYGDLFLDGPPLPTMLSLSATGGGDDVYRGPVVYLGSLSKSLVPGLRVGWVIADPDLVRALTLAKQGTDLASSALAQAIALDIVESGLLERRLPDLLAEYRRRRDAICAAARERLADTFAFTPPAGGMFLWLTARKAALDTTELFERASAAGVLVSPSLVFDPRGRDRSGLRLNFTLNPPDRLALGIARLAEATARPA